jgi:hypothetical protein
MCEVSVENGYGPDNRCPVSDSDEDSSLQHYIKVKYGAHRVSCRMTWGYLIVVNAIRARNSLFTADFINTLRPSGYYTYNQV